MGPGSLWGNIKALNRLQPWGIKRNIMARGEGSWRGRSILDVDRASHIFRTQGLRSLRCGFLSQKTRGLVHLWGLATVRNNLGRGNWVNILGHSARRFMITKCTTMKNARNGVTCSIEGLGFLSGELMEESMRVLWIQVH
jgi:hypothetical protein